MELPPSPFSLTSRRNRAQLPLPKRGRPPALQPPAAPPPKQTLNPRSHSTASPSKVTKSTSAAAAAAKGIKGTANKTKQDPTLLESIVSTNLKVLAMLMREQEKGAPRERAEMDGLMSSRFVET
ncbi:hypothetical protein W97_03819 [Coniosporium apollinis CBS 100218]|uniref:Uncharacterized protein n=1 Tax=Coniosporium apollinis (strain CBS 100218) TaxID=1168221 RepID=R7YSI8_CONA1|nr:uncharacterized protein W97_03819 [Coniosporium apollinis CBS 100218]EON64586.1 hypothetical protein W97_03819 [Coniosporium apollinis CBS 100218]